ncbi:hypothetical protein HS088_TW21G00901 [Tripterygium wilfordii]|uniref:DCD domain-containing protein n=1 Tax=Tripterygium wilfordii TaxID=458696 RepID=A0A7J7C3L3_TRIWF|nr:uncharacterized protein LOC119988780 [Tripterygium wilfordii]KAF5728749.1 hypothetical protein HS088_TW21G00901 [Tripterygium wilfordii]
MEFNEEQNGASGTIPEFGAIFMSNAATKRECFKRKLFGLPPRMTHFVKHVKTGMMLFMFEFENRELYGVFQACCDGAMNIIPNAFSSFGNFPAQVKFVPIWLCSPLPEDEFYDAIKENYFSSKKFNFGLDEDQVHRLLSLFSLRKFKDMTLHRQFSRSQFTRPTGYSRSKVRKRVDGGRLFLTDATEDEHNLDHSCRAVNSMDYPRDSFRGDGRFARSALSEDESKMNDEFGLAIKNDYSGKFGRVPDNDRFASTDEIGNKCNVDTECGPFISTKYAGYPLHEIGTGRVADDFIFGMSDRECDRENDIEPPVSIELSGVLPPSLNKSVLYGLPTLGTDSLVDDHLRPSPTVHFPMKPQITSLSSSKVYGDAVSPISNFSSSTSFGTSAIPYEPDAPSFSYEMSSPHLVDHSSNSPQKHARQKRYVRKISPTLDSQSLPLHREHKVTSNWLDCKSDVDNNASFPYLNSYENSYRTSVHFMEPAYSENRPKRYDENEDSTGFVRHSSLSFPPFPEKGNGSRTDEEPSKFFNPIEPSARFEYSYPVGSKQEHVRKIPWCEDDDSFVVNVPTSKEVHCLQQDCSVNGRDIGYADFSSIHDDFHQNSDGKYFGSNNKRNSVFSRLALAPGKIKPENRLHIGNNESGVGRSVDELMAMLHQSRQEWVKTESSRSSFKRLDSVKNSSMKKQISLNPKLPNTHSQKAHKATKTNAIPADEENTNQVSEGTPFVDFKRRSELQKPHVDVKTGGTNVSAESDGSLGGRHKKRKLIRPNFNKNDSSDDKELDEDTIQNMQAPGHESNVYTDKTRGCDALRRSLDCKSWLPQKVEVSSHLCQAGYEDMDVIAGGDLSSQVNKMLENSGATFRFTPEHVAKSSQNMSPSTSCKQSGNNGGKILSTMDSISQDFDDADRMIMPEASLELRVVNVEKECLRVDQDGSNKEVLENVEVICKCGSISDEATPGNLSDSINEISKLEETGDELLGIQVTEESGQNKQQVFQNSGEASPGLDCDNARHMIVPESSLESWAVKAKNGCLYFSQDLSDKEDVDASCKCGLIHDEESSGNLSNSINRVSGLENAVEDILGLPVNEDGRRNKQLVFQDCDEAVHGNISSSINQNSGTGTGTGTSGEKFLEINVNEAGGGNKQRGPENSCDRTMGKLRRPVFDIIP